MKYFSYLLFPLFFLLLGQPAEHSKIISCAPTRYEFRATITSVQSGNWSDPATWGGRVPVVADAPVISQGHTVFVDADASIAGMQVTGILMFDPTRSATLTSTKNIIVTGLLEMLSPKPEIFQTIRFTGINENNFAGGGMDPVATDVGLWVMGVGRLHLQGADKTSWTNSAGAIAAGATTITVNHAIGWRAGDEVEITATSAGATNFEMRVIKTISTGLATIINDTLKIAPYNISLTAGATAHPVINSRWAAEVGNLTRNVRIEGTAAGRSHVFIRSTSPQYIRNVAFRYLGPRKDQNGDKITDLILGRYGSPLSPLR
jgi:hypothetical protein